MSARFLRLGGLAITAIVTFLGWGTVAGAASARLVFEPNSATVYADEAVVLSYRYEDVPFKPYVKELFTPSGLNVLLDAPHDHLHHHALMFAVAVDGVNFWAETEGSGGQAHNRFDRVSTDCRRGMCSSGFTHRILWVDPNGRPLLEEDRQISVAPFEGPGPTYVMWRTTLSVPDGRDSVTLSGSHYFGLGLRFIRSMDAVGEFRNADNESGVVYRGDERLVRSRWCAYSAPVEGKVVTVAMYGSPMNPRHPTTWFTMAKPFAYLSATLGLHEEPLEIVAGKPLMLHYHILLWDRAVTWEELDREYSSTWGVTERAMRRIRDENR